MSISIYYKTVSWANVEIEEKWQAYFLQKKDRYDLYIMTSKPFKRCAPVYLSLLMLSESHIWQVGGPTWTSGGANLLNWTGLDSTRKMLHHL